MACGHQFRAGQKITGPELWKKYLHGKQTIAQLSKSTKLSESTIKRKLKAVVVEWVQPSIIGCGVVHMDATYFSRQSGVLVALEAGSGKLLYMRHITHEHAADYEAVLNHITAHGYTVTGVVIDGNRTLFEMLGAYPIQMCQFHMVAIVRRKLTKNPQLPAGQELLNIAYRLKNIGEAEFQAEFSQWKSKWHDFLLEKTKNQQTGKTIYTHQRLRSAMLSLSYYLKWLFTFEHIDNMPNTNNALEGTFTELKRMLRNHPGLSEANRRKLVDGFFLAYAELHNFN